MSWEKGLFSLKIRSTWMCILAVIMAVAHAQEGQSPGGVPQSRLQVLTRGLNANWDNWSPDKVRAQVQEWKSLGYRHVRLFTHLDQICEEGHIEKITPQAFSVYLRYAQIAKEERFAIILDLLHYGPRWASKRLHGDGFLDGDGEEIVEFWSKFANELKGTDPEFVFLEMINEPIGPTYAEFNAILKRWIKVVRKSVPNHTLIVDFLNSWKDIDRMTEHCQVDEDPNVVYNVHNYIPVALTHDGMEWAKIPFKDTQYPSVDFNKKHLEEYIQKYADWLKLHQRHGTINEWGCAKRTNVESRLRYYEDFSSLCDRHMIGWALWRDCVYNDHLPSLAAIGFPQRPLPIDVFVGRGDR